MRLLPVLQLAMLLAPSIGSEEYDASGLQCDEDGHALLQAKTVTDRARVLQEGPEHVQCSLSDTMCAGNQCCPGAVGSDGKTYPCPSADDDWNQCETAAPISTMTTTLLGAAAEQVKCKFTSDKCARNECCPGAPQTDNKSYPCPTADLGWNKCDRTSQGSGKNTIGFSYYTLQPGVSTLMTVSLGLTSLWYAAFPAEFGHAGVFWLPFDIITPDWGKTWSKGRECGTQQKNLGTFNSAMACAMQVEKEKDCGPVFMWSKIYPSWGCRCCKYGKADHGNENELWDLYQSYANWMCYDGGDGQYAPPEDLMKIEPHSNGNCGTSGAWEASRWEGYGVEVTYSDGYSGKEYDQTFALGEPGRYIHNSGSDKIWHGKAHVMKWITTDLTFEQFMEAAQTIAYSMNVKGGYDAAVNNCQDFSLRMLTAIGADGLHADLEKMTFVGRPLSVSLAKEACSLGWLAKMCWGCPGCHVKMPDVCKPNYTIPHYTPTNFSPTHTCIN